jgi:tetratricopeptide (TPR) repeat protein
MVPQSGGEAIEIERDRAEVHANLALALIAEGQADEAIGHLSKAVRINPDLADAHYNLALALEDRGRAAEAADHYTIALRQRPEWPMALIRLARIRATAVAADLRNGDEAVRLAAHACRLTNRQEPAFLDTLAAAYAEAGRFPEAVAALKEAIALAASSGHGDDVAELQGRLPFYEAGRPWREAEKKTE